MFTRHPLERMLSAYLNKFGGFHNNTYFNNRYGKRIISRYRPMATYMEKSKGAPISLEELSLLVNYYSISFI